MPSVGEVPELLGQIADADTEIVANSVAPDLV